MVFLIITTRTRGSDILDSAISCGLGGFAGWLIGLFAWLSLNTFLESAMVGFFFTGLIMGISQWPLLRKSIKYAGCWIFAHAITMSAAGGFFPSNIERTVSLTDEIIIGSFFYGVVSGIALIYLLASSNLDRRNAYGDYAWLGILGNIIFLYIITSNYGDTLVIISIWLFLGSIGGVIGGVITKKWWGAVLSGFIVSIASIHLFSGN